MTAKSNTASRVQGGDYNLDTVIVVLGSVEEGEQLVRAETVARLAQDHPNTLVVFTGHNGEAAKLCSITKVAGLPANQPFVLEQASTNTRDNAIHTSVVLAELGFNTSTVEVIMVTSRFHAVRAFMTFRAYFGNVRMVSEKQDVVRAARTFGRFFWEELPRIGRYSRRKHLYPFAHHP